jgi:hypothetical protein
MKNTSLLGALLLVLGCTGKIEPVRMGEEPLPTLVAQRVTATVRREALQLVRIETEHEAFLTTPEHPFATPHSGWISAGRLVAGDWVVSERFGAVRLLSARSEPAAREVPVFNLSVSPSHTYFVGTDRVLVHNTKCKPDTSEEAVAQLVRERDELTRQINDLKKTAPTSPRIAELRIERNRLSQRIGYLRRLQHQEQGATPRSNDAKGRELFEAEQEAARKALEAARRELAELESQPRASEAEKAAFETRKAELEKRIASLKLTEQRASRILTLLRELGELEKAKPARDAERQAHEKKKHELRAELDLERKRAKALKSYNKKRSDPEWREERAKYQRAQGHRLLRSPTYLADTERARDRLELLEAELAGLAHAPPSQSRDERMHHLEEQIKTMKRLVELRREARMLMQQRRRMGDTREMLIAKGEGTSEIHQKIEQTAKDLHANRIQRAQLRVKERLLALLDRTPWSDAPESVDEARLREFERQLAAGLESEQQLADIERALDAMDPTDADWEEAVREEAHDVDETLRAREALLRQSPSRERAAGLQSSSERLRRELREERLAVEAAVSALTNEYASIHTTQASSSSGRTWQQRLQDIREEQDQLLAQWRARLRERLESARRELNAMRSVERFRDEETEAELAGQIALLERELQSAGG